MTLVERSERRFASSWLPSTWTQRFFVATAVFALLAGLATTSTASAATIAQEKAQAASLYSQIQRINFTTQELGQRYDLAHLKLNRMVNQIRNTKAIVKSIDKDVKVGRKQLKADAIFAFVTNGGVSASNPLFATSATTLGPTNVYNTLAEGNVGSAVARLTNDRLQLTQERSLLRSEVAAAAHQNYLAEQSYARARGLDRTLNADLASIKGRIASYYNALAAAAAARSAAALQSSQPTSGSNGAPPPNSVGAIAVKAAESFIGVPYCWGGASRSCVDCSGLVMLAYDAAGIYFSHYSGAMYQDTQPVPLWNIQPGDLLFYGYGGDEHVAMYVGGGQMIEAPCTGSYVHITPIRLGYGFAGVGRPR
jgi:cell wall-associated NlpC family hydrolase